MADTTEKKTYLVNIESNLDKYSEDAAAAAKEVEKLTVENVKLKGSTTATAKDIEANNAALRNAQKEYKQAKNLVDLQTSANKAQAGSYEQLLRIHRLNEIALKTASGTMKRNEDGTYSLTAKYIALSKNVDTSKRALDAFGKGIHDNRLNVGNYSEALKGALGSISAMPGPLGRAAAGAENFAATFAKIGPIGALIGGALLAISAPLVAFFKSSEEGIELLERKVAGFKASINVLKGDLISLGKSMVGEQGDEAAPWGSRLVKGLKLITTTANLIPGVSKYFDDLAKRMNEAGAAAEKYTLIQQQLEDAERALIVPRAEANLKIKEARLLYADETKSLEVRIGALQTALDLENKTADEEVKHQQFKILNLRDQNEEKRKAGQLLDEDDKRLQEAIAREIELRTESVGRQVRAANTLKTARAELLKEESDGIKKIAKEHHDQELKAFEEAGKFIEEEIKLMDAKAEHKWKTEVELGKALFDFNEKQAKDAWDAMLVADKKQEDKDKERESVRQAIMQAGIDGARTVADSIFQIRSNRLDAQMRKELSNQNLTEKQRAAIVKKYAKEQQKIAIIQAVINGALGVVTSLAGPPIYKWIEAAAVAVATLAQIAVIKSQSIDGGGGGGGATAISSSAPAQRAFAQPAGSSVLTQAQLSQPQLNAIPNQNTLTAADIANALKGLPPPVVTVEDINAKVKSVNKVAVRANI